MYELPRANWYQRGTKPSVLVGPGGFGTRSTRQPVATMASVNATTSDFRTRSPSTRGRDPTQRDPRPPNVVCGSIRSVAAPVIVFGMLDGMVDHLFTRAQQERLAA